LSLAFDQLPESVYGQHEILGDHKGLLTISTAPDKWPDGSLIDE
jgi:hypothetical protein